MDRVPLALALGVMMLAISAGSLVMYLATGSLSFTHKGVTYTGSTAAFLVWFLFVAGSVCTWTAIRKLRK